MAIEPFAEDTQPALPNPARDRARPSSRAMKAARERLRMPSDPGIAQTARELDKRASSSRLDTTAPLTQPRTGVAPPPVRGPIASGRAERAVTVERAPARPRGSTITFVLVVVLVALLVVAGGLFVLASP